MRGFERGSSAKGAARRARSDAASRPPTGEFGLRRVSGLWHMFPPFSTRGVPPLVPQRIQQVRFTLEGEEQEVSHAEGGVVGPKRRMKARVAHNRELAAFDRAMERFGCDSRADTL